MQFVPLSTALAAAIPAGKSSVTVTFRAAMHDVLLAVSETSNGVPLVSAAGAFNPTLRSATSPIAIVAEPSLLLASVSLLALTRIETLFEPKTLLRRTRLIAVELPPGI